MPALWDKLEARSESNLYFALAFLPSAQRDAFRDVYRFLRGADDLVDDPALGEADKRAGLASYRRELDLVFAGTPHDHPTARRLAATVARLGLSRAHFDTVLDALEEDITRRRVASEPELLAWCEKLSSTLAYLSLEILGARSPAARAYARDMGIALQLANILRDVDEDARGGRVYLPETLLVRHGASAVDVLAHRSSPGLSAACAELARRTKDLMASARAHLPDAPREELRALEVPEIWADVYRASIDRLAAVGHDPFAGGLRLRRRKKLRIALVAAARGAARRRLAGAWRRLRSIRS